MSYQFTKGETYRAYVKSEFQNSGGSSGSYTYSNAYEFSYEVVSDWFDFIRVIPYTIEGIDLNINEQTPMIQGGDSRDRRYNVYGNKLVVVNDPDTTLPSEYNDLPKWRFREE